MNKNWQIRCTKCCATRPAAKAGIIRLGAVAPLGVWTLGWCRNCRRLRLAEIERVRPMSVAPQRTA